MKIKVCGLTDAENINAVIALSPHYAGFICYGPSPRYIATLVPYQLSALPSSVYKTAVFVNEEVEVIHALISEFGFNAIQLHGNESPGFCSTFKGKVQVIKAFGVDDDFDFNLLNDYEAYVDLFLFDTKTAGHGGSGKSFNWDILNKYQLDTPFFLSGGISLDNLEEIKKIEHPKFYGVDLNSRFETEPGIKDIKKLTEAFDIITQFNTNGIRS
ncbi:phosphoribosylanthranilate isomerase [soil metagenome]|jgi:phosphoribosylanthranilate isomerase